MPITMGSLFDGIGGFPLAAVRHGITPVWASEIEPFPIAVTKLRFPDMQHVGDLTQLDGATLPPVDIITGGSPCQDLSIAGKRQGLAGERSGLFMEQIRIVKEMRDADKRAGRADELVRPRYMVWENVPGAFSSADGEDFRAVLEETCRIADSTVSIPRPPAGAWYNAGCIMGDGYSLAFRVLDCRYWTLAQRRRRIFLVFDFAGHTAPKILFDPDRVPWNITQGESAGQGAARGAAQSTGDTGGIVAFACNQRDEVRDLHNVSGAVQAQPDMKQQTFIAENCSEGGTSYLTGWDTQQARIFTENGISPTLAGADGGGGRNPSGLLFAAAFSPKAGAKASGIGYERECSPTLTNNTPSVICLNDQGGSQMYCSEDVVGTLRAQEHGHQPLVMATQQGGAEICEDLCPAIAASAGLSRNGQPVLFENHGKDSRYNGPLDVAPTISAAYGSGGNNVPLTMKLSQPHAFSLDSAESNSMKSANPYSGCRETQLARTIDTTNPCPSKNQGGIAIVQETYAIAGNIIHRQDKNGGNGMGFQPDISYTLNTVDRHAVFSQQRSDTYMENTVACTQSARQYKDATDLVCDAAVFGQSQFGNYKEGCSTLRAQGGDNGGGSENLVTMPSLNLVRRLTPLECERLMGFPDGWTDITKASDSARYRALGNSLAIPCVEFILQGIAIFMHEQQQTEQE